MHSCGNNNACDDVKIQNRGANSKMWEIKQIFDGDYGCEERQPGEPAKVTVYLEDENGNEKVVRAEDDWLIKNNLDEGGIWPE